VLQTAATAGAAAGAQRARNRAADLRLLGGGGGGVGGWADGGGAQAAVAAGAAGAPRAAHLSPAEAVAHAAADAVVAMLAPPEHRPLLMRYVAEGGARAAAALRALLRCVDLVSAHEAVAAQESACVAMLTDPDATAINTPFAEATPLHEDCYLLPLPTRPPSLPRLLAADADAAAATTATTATTAAAAAAGAPTAAAAAPTAAAGVPAAVDVGAGVSGAMARLALWQGAPLTPSPTEPCAGAAREGAPSLSLLPEDLASLVMARRLHPRVRARARVRVRVRGRARARARVRARARARVRARVTARG